MQYASKDEKLKKERARKFRKRLAIAGAAVGLVGLLTNTLPIVEAVGGKKGVSEVSRYFPMMKLVPQNEVNPGFDFNFIFGDKIHKARLSYAGLYKYTPVFTLGYTERKIVERDTGRYKDKYVKGFDKIISFRE